MFSITKALVSTCRPEGGGIAGKLSRKTICCDRFYLPPLSNFSPSLWTTLGHPVKRASEQTIEQVISYRPLPLDGLVGYREANRIFENTNGYESHAPRLPDSKGWYESFCSLVFCFFPLPRLLSPLSTPPSLSPSPLPLSPTPHNLPPLSHASPASPLPPPLEQAAEKQQEQLAEK